MLESSAGVPGRDLVSPAPWNDQRGSFLVPLLTSRKGPPPQVLHLWLYFLHLLVTYKDVTLHSYKRFCEVNFKRSKQKLS